MRIQLKSNFFRLKGILGMGIFFTLILLSFNPVNRLNVESTSMMRSDFSGTNSLYIGVGKEMDFKWITSQKDIGRYELISSDNKVISSGETEMGNVHEVSIAYSVKEPVIFKFGGKNEPLASVKLRPAPKRENDTFKDVDSLYVVGDVHGRYHELVSLLQKAKIIDAQTNWTAGKSHLVFLGDLFDRGNDVTRVLWLIYKLEQEAQENGGKVHLVLGNHEIMTLTNDLSYLAPKEAFIAKSYKKGYAELFHPTKSLLGSWLGSKPAVLKIDKNLFAHGGILDLGTTIPEFNHTVHTYMQSPIFLDLGLKFTDSIPHNKEEWRKMKTFFYDEENPFWYRGYVVSDTLETQLTSMLKKYRSEVHIVAHTPRENISQKYGGKLLTTDLNEKATQLLFIHRNKNRTTNYMINKDGIVAKLE